MSNRKNYNSIVFLTTLSLYLGLVLAGGSATPTVLAQAATTRNFDIKSEIVVEDDLDKKPDDEVSSESKPTLDQSDKQFFEQYAEIVLATLGRNYSPKAADFDKGVYVSYSSLENDELFQSLFPTLRKELVIDDFNYTLEKDKIFAKFKLKSRFDEDISHVFNAYVSSLNALRFDARNESENVILKNTELTFENNQVFIVTRLPRASIDALAAKK
jgi:hypothetical protein